MSAEPILRRLLALRRQHEQRALEAAMQCDGACRRAAQQVDAAGDAVLRHAAASRAQERELTDILVGVVVSRNALRRLQADLDAAAIEQDRLRAVQAEALSALREHDEARDAARAELRRRHRNAAKLDLLLQQHAARHVRRQQAFAEAADEDRGRPAPSAAAGDVR